MMIMHKFSRLERSKIKIGISINFLLKFQEKKKKVACVALCRSEMRLEISGNILPLTIFSHKRANNTVNSVGEGKPVKSINSSKQECIQVLLVCLPMSLQK